MSHSHILGPNYTQITPHKVPPVRRRCGRELTFEDLKFLHSWLREEGGKTKGIFTQALSRTKNVHWWIFKGCYLSDLKRRFHVQSKVKPTQTLHEGYHCATNQQGIHALFFSSSSHCGCFGGREQVQNRPQKKKKKNLRKHENYFN